MERDRSPDLCDARSLVASSKGGCSAGDRVANIDPQGNVYPCQFARAPEFLVGNVRERPFSELWDDASNPVLARFRETAGAIDRAVRHVPAPRTLRRGLPGAGLRGLRRFLCR